MTNTSSFDKDLLGQKATNGYQRASSFDLTLFRVNKEWDEGVGYDYNKITSTDDDTITYIDGASNWLFATSSTNWDQEGVYSGAPTSITVTTQSFDNGNEDIVYV